MKRAGKLANTPLQPTSGAGTSGWIRSDHERRSRVTGRVDQDRAAPAAGGVLVALVVLLRGVNVGGHRTFRPTTLTKQLKHLDAVNIGAAGTFVIRRPIKKTQLP